MGQIGSKEMCLILAKFGITVMSSRLIDITGSRKIQGMDITFSTQSLMF